MEGPLLKEKPFHLDVLRLTKRMEKFKIARLPGPRIWMAHLGMDPA